MAYNTKTKFVVKRKAVAVLDTNFLYSLVEKEDSNHTKAKEEFLELESYDKIVIPVLVMAEISVGLGFGNAIKLCGSITDFFEPVILADLQIFDDLETSIRKSLKANDCLILSIANRVRGDLITFDKRLLSCSKVLFSVGD